MSGLIESTLHGRRQKKIQGWSSTQLNFQACGQNPNVKPKGQAASKTYQRGVVSVHYPAAGLASGLPLRC